MQHSEGDSDDDSEAPESSPATARSAISRETSPPVGAAWIESLLCMLRKLPCVFILLAVCWLCQACVAHPGCPSCLCCTGQGAAAAAATRHEGGVAGEAQRRQQQPQRPARGQLEVAEALVGVGSGRASCVALFRKRFSVAACMLSGAQAASDCPLCCSPNPCPAGLCWPWRAASCTTSSRRKKCPHPASTPR